MKVQCAICGKLIDKPQSKIDKTQTHYCSMKCRTKKIMIKCKICGKEFKIKQSEYPKKKYCSMECRNVGLRTHKYNICVVCGQKFEVGIGTYRNKTCSPICASESAVISRGAIPIKEQQCLMCGETYKPTSNRGSKFCSSKCYHDYTRTLPTKVCLTCGKEFRPYSKYDIAKFCSKTCVCKYKGETSIEAVMREELTKRKIPFEQEVSIGSYTVDFLIKDIIIECDGLYWHKDNRYDYPRNRRLQLLGFKVIRFTQMEIKSDIGACVGEIEEIMKTKHSRYEDNQC